MVEKDKPKDLSVPHSDSFAIALQRLGPSLGEKWFNEIAEKTGITTQYLWAIRRGKRIGSESLRRKIASLFKMSLDEFLELGEKEGNEIGYAEYLRQRPGRVNRGSESQTENGNNVSTIEDEDKHFSQTAIKVLPPSPRSSNAGLNPLSSSDFVSVPKVSVLLSAGEGEFVHEENVVSEFAFRRDWLHTKSGLNNKVVLEVKGDSMQPIIKSGDHVLVDTSETGQRIIPNSIYAVREGGAASIKILRWIQAPEKLELISANPDQAMYPPRTITIEEGDSSPVLGRVIWLGREL